MPTVDQMLRTTARELRGVPYWVVEKDYAISYLLAGITCTERLAEALVLKGGTALRKFYFADYRFSEDLDFTLRHPMPHPEVQAAVGEAVRATQQMLQERGPFSAQSEPLELRDPHPGGQQAFTVRIQFPTQREPLCRLKVEITADEEVVLPPERRALLHQFPEELEAVHWCYALEEMAAEKLRALLQSRSKLRARGWGASRVCRDYYDLWRLLGSAELRGELVPSLVSRKCALRGVAFESPADFFAPQLVEVARAEWERQLCPFVSDCPSVGQVLEELRPRVEGLWTEI